MAIYKRISDILNYITNNYEFNNLFLCNADKWYSYYEKIKYEKRLTYSLNLLEEGLTTYIVSSDESYQNEIIQKTTFRDIKKNFADLSKFSKKLFSYLKLILVKLVVIVLNLISIIFRTNLVQKIKSFLLNKTMKEKYKFSYIKHFDNAFVCFPQKLEQVNFSIDNVKKLNFTFNNINFNHYSNCFDKNDILFINQKYVNYPKHFEILFDIFSEMNISNIKIKLHPKENKEQVLKVISEIVKDYDNLNVDVITNLDGIPIEDVIYNFKFKKIIGITSSSLIYCNEFIHDIDIISVATRYRQMCYDKSNEVMPKELNLFEKEYKNFLKFSNLKQYININGTEKAGVKND